MLKVAHLPLPLATPLPPGLPITNHHPEDLPLARGSLLLATTSTVVVPLRMADTVVKGTVAMDEVEEEEEVTEEVLGEYCLS